MSNYLEVKLVDSFVLNKLGEGHGESRLYLGGHGLIEKINKIFCTLDNRSVELKLSKDNLLAVVNFYKPFFKNQKKFYLSNGKLLGFKHCLKDIWNENWQLIKNSDQYIYEPATIILPDKKGRTYLRVKPDSLLRKLFLPHSVRVIFSNDQNHFNQVDCEIKSEIKPVKKQIKVNGTKLSIEFDYFNDFEY